jgi:hypothetical protein
MAVRSSVPAPCEGAPAGRMLSPPRANYHRRRGGTRYLPMGAPRFLLLCLSSVGSPILVPALAVRRAVARLAELRASNTSCMKTACVKRGSCCFPFPLYAPPPAAYPLLLATATAFCSAFTW